MYGDIRSQLQDIISSCNQPGTYGRVDTDKLLDRLERFWNGESLYDIEREEEE